MSEANNPKPTPPWFSLSNQAIGFCIGMVVCAALVFYVPKNYPKITEILHGVYYMAFGAALLVFIIIVGFKPYVQRFILNRAPNKARGVIEDMQNVSNHVAIQLLNLLPTPPSEDIKTRAQAILPGLTNMLIWARLRNWWWQWILGIFVAIGGLMGTILLMNQNELLDNQNTLIQRQMSLEEASRRGALVVLMSNIMDKVDDEIKEQKNELRDKGLSKAAVDTMTFSLSQSLIGQIAALSHSFKPYRFLDADTLIGKPLSPERGQLLITLTRLPFDSITFASIYQSSTFVEADLRNAILRGVKLAGVDLRNANLSNVDLRWANLSQANLSDANVIQGKLWDSNCYSVDLTNANLIEADFCRSSLNFASMNNSNLLKANLCWADLEDAILDKASLENADLEGTNLSGASLNKVKFIGSNMAGIDLIGVDLSDADFTMATLCGADLTGSNLSLEQAKSARNLFDSRGLDSIEYKLMQSHRKLFDKPKNYNSRIREERYRIGQRVKRLQLPPY